MRATRAGVALALLALGVGRAGATELLVGGAASLRGPLEEIAAQFEQSHPELRVRLAFGASNVLARQVRAGAPLDAFVSADERIVAALVRDGVLASESVVAIARNRLVVLAAPDRTLAQASDLAHPDVRRIAIPEHAVPVGRYARSWLMRHGLIETLEPRMLRTEHARATLAAVDQGHADVAIVYASDARLARRARVALDIPDAEQPRIAYAAARVSASRHSDATDALLRFLIGSEAVRIFSRAGFSAVGEGTHAP